MSLSPAHLHSEYIRTLISMVGKVSNLDQTKLMDRIEALIDEYGELYPEAVERGSASDA